jgi:replicative DNA helicase
MISSAQKAILGAIMLNSRTYVGMCVDKGVQAEWFFGDARKMYEKAVEDFVNGKVTNAVTISKVLTEESVGLPDECIDACTTVAHTGRNIEVLELEVMEQDSMLLADQQHLVAQGGIDDIKLFVEDAARSWGDLIIKDKTTMSDTEVALSQLDKWESPEYDKGRIDWPLPGLNKMIGSLEEEFVFIGAQPSTGKTALTLQMCDMLGDPSIKEEPIISSFSSLESPQRQLAIRRSCRLSSSNSWRLKNRYSDASDYQSARNGAEALKRIKTRMKYGGMNLEQIRAWAFREQQAGSKLLVIDNLKHVRVNSRGRSKPEVMGETVTSLKQIKDDVAIPMIVLHQLNSEDGMAWTADVERDADIMMYLKENEARSVKATEANDYQALDVVKVELAKARDGAKNLDLDVRFVKQFQQFKDMAQIEGDR